MYRLLITRCLAIDILSVNVNYVCDIMWNEVYKEVDVNYFALIQHQFYHELVCKSHLQVVIVSAACIVELFANILQTTMLGTHV